LLADGAWLPCPASPLQPDHPTAYYKAASLLKNLGKHEEAVAGFRQHLRLHPNDTDTLFW
jgi:TolA-binding protein